MTVIAPSAHSQGHRLAGGKSAGNTGFSSTSNMFSNSNPIAPPVTAESPSTINHCPMISLRNWARPAPNVFKIATRS
ncbi:Uncharacterised protein [Salmonella enterica subsp. enterica serovar Bovismorbificans]|uniref:Uncharacterized protein n=1 Tax=Salmonella enterica subsp. enterica serovar Bovismorbificans TaxID=58097 RepID=A0A655C5Z3_SALET|nr:Uncharacterised protein [Salmonella enterica subsp. enterica serovar Bovismorbificans]CNT97933.1 Uncharacterised protein [Salmonella enterica subsp. enterica serovar Bovismorbificans]